ncbi:MAG: hypothetical protein WAN38_12830, partial [Terriglobales bacterium]
MTRKGQFETEVRRWFSLVAAVVFLAIVHVHGYGQTDGGSARTINISINALSPNSSLQGGGAFTL